MVIFTKRQTAIFDHFMKLKETVFLVHLKNIFNMEILTLEFGQSIEIKLLYLFFDLFIFTHD